MSNALNLLVPFLAFFAAMGATFTALSHYRPQLIRALEQRETEVQTSLERLGLEIWSARTIIRLRYLVAPAVAALLFLLFRTSVLAFGIAAILYGLPQLLLQNAWRRQREQLESQVLDFISALVATSKAGMNLHQALEDIADRLPPPISRECQGILRRLEAGQTMESALLETEQRLALPNLSLVIQSLVVHERRGGRLPALLERIGASLREIERVEERVRTETSGIKLSSRIMAAMPAVICFLLYLASPDHVVMLFRTTLGNLLLLAAAGLDYLGFSMIRSLGEVEV